MRGTQAMAGAPATPLRRCLAPLVFDGGAVSGVLWARRGGGLSGRRGPRDGILHEDMDEARNLLVQDMMYSGGLAKLAFANGAGPQAPAAGARYATDGLRAVLFLATRPLSLADVEFLDWAPFLGLQEPPGRTENPR